MAAEVTKILSTETSSWDPRNGRARLRNASLEGVGRGDGFWSRNLMFLDAHGNLSEHFSQSSEGEVTDSGPVTGT